MGWANCGEDSIGRPIGYAHAAICDAPGCAVEIDRGLGYKCGPMHGSGEWYCEGYFCEKHRQNSLPIEDREWQVCEACYDRALAYARENPEDADELAVFFRDQGEEL